MRVWVYDGSFEGMLCAVHAWFYAPDKPDAIYSEQAFEPDLISEVHEIHTDAATAKRVGDGIVQKLGSQTFELMLKAYLSEDPRIAEIIARYLKYAFKGGPDVIKHLANPDVAAFAKRSAAVSRESHKLIGLIRFVELESGILYGVYESTYSQLLILAPHFSMRLSNQTWVLHDKKRGMAAFYRSGSWHLAPLEGDYSNRLSEAEGLIQGLWQRYYKHIAIEQRKNLKLQRQNMPKKYWKYLIEMQAAPKNGEV